MTDTQYYLTNDCDCVIVEKNVTILIGRDMTMNGIDSPAVVLYENIPELIDLLNSIYNKWWKDASPRE